MKDKLEPNMYVRTKYGIFKIRKITKDLAYWKHEKRVIELDRNIPEYNYRFSFYKDESIFKGAKFKDNIIDLIEVGDYVNGKKIVDVGCLTNGPRKGTKVIDYYITPSAVSYLENEDIKSIVTKEQFENMEYRIG